MIKTEHLSKTYRSGLAEINALSDVTFTLPDNGLIFILGKSGSGKTTLLNLLGGMDRQTSGSIVIDGTPLMPDREKELDRHRNNNVGFVFQEFNLLDNYTVGSNIELALELQGRKASREKTDEILRRVELTDSGGNTLYDRKINELSGGQKQRVAIARALIKDPRIILADEPTGALDSRTGKALFELLRELSKTKLIVVVSHDRESAEKFGDRIIELSDGELVSDRIINELPAAEARVIKPVVKGGLPFGRILTMGIAGFKKKTVRLVISVLLAVIAFTAFVFSASAMNVDTITSELKTAYAGGAKTITLNSYVKWTQKVVYADGQFFENYNEYDNTFSQGQLDLLSADSKFYPVLDAPYASGYLDMEGLDNSSRLNPYNYFANNLITRYVVTAKSVTEEDLGISPITENSRLPVTSAEIAITDYHADMFMRFGYKNDVGEVQRIDTPEDMIGKVISGCKVVGVYSTEESLEWLKQYDKDFNGVYLGNYSDDFYIDIDDYFFDWSRGDHMIKTAFIGSEGLETTNIFKVLYRLTGSVKQDRRIIESLFYNDDTVEKTENMTYYKSWSHTVYVTSAYSGFTQAAWMFTNEVFLLVMLIAGIVLAVFSSLLLMNFLLTSTSMRQREVGILRALGASKSDTVGICLTESGIIGIIDFILSLVCGGLMCLIINNIFHFYLFGLGVLPVVYLALLCFGSVALATILPALRIASKKPVDIIYGK